VGEPEVLPHLQPARAPGDGLVELRAQRTGRVVGGQRGPVEVAEGDEPAGVGAVVAREVGVELVAPAPVEVDDGRDVVRVEHRH
jgi:hypothetical protein